MLTFCSNPGSIWWKKPPKKFWSQSEVFLDCLQAFQNLLKGPKHWKEGFQIIVIWVLQSEALRCLNECKKNYRNPMSMSWENVQKHAKNGNISKCSNFSMFLDVFSAHKHRIAIILFAIIQASRRVALKYPHDYIPSKKFSLFWGPFQILMWHAGIEDDMLETWNFGYVIF